jgi:hypothetical protein
MKNGRIEPDGLSLTGTEGVYHVLTRGEAFRSFFGFGPKNPGALWTNASPHTIELWLGTVSNIENQEADNSFSMPLLTKDEHQASANVTVTVSVNPSKAYQLLNLPELRANGVFNTSTLAKKLKTEVIANVVTPEVEQHTLKDLRGNTKLRTQLRETLITELSKTLDWYGLQLTANVFSISWGLTEEERNRIEKRRLEWQALLNPPAEKSDSGDSTESGTGTGANWTNTGDIQGDVNVTQNVNSEDKPSRIRSIGMLVARLGVMGAIGEVARRFFFG